MLSKKIHLSEAKELYKHLKSKQKVSETLCEKYGVKYNETIGRYVRSWLTDKEKTSDTFKEAQKRKIDKSKFYLVTSAQNATPINKSLLQNMEAYAEFLNASIVCIPIRYKNPTSVFSDLKEEYWNQDIEKYLVARRDKVHKYLTILGDLKTQPTAAMPLTGIEGLTGLESSIIGHPRQHLKTMPVLEGYPSKVLMSTGSITLSNYTDSKIGKKSDFHHTYGFIVIEVRDEETFHIRHVSASKNGEFYDLDYFVSKGEVQKDSEAVDTLVLGDVHVGSVCDDSIKATYKMLERFNPKNVVLHDLADGYSISHHDAHNPFVLLEKERDNKNSIENELEECLKFLKPLVKYNPIVIRSNHNDFFDRWLMNTDWRKENNKYAYLKYAKLRADGFLVKGILAWEIQEKFGDNIKCLDSNKSFRIKGIEVSQHGDLGANGSRGSANQFKTLNTKIITAHSHTPMKIDGFSSVGTLTNLRLSYNKGLSNWLNSNIIIHKNGKNQNLLIIKGKFTSIK